MFVPRPSLQCLSVDGSLGVLPIASTLAPLPYSCYGIDTLTGGATLMLLPEGGVCAGNGRNTLSLFRLKDGTGVVTVTVTVPLWAAPAGLTTENG